MSSDSERKVTVSMDHQWVAQVLPESCPICDGEVSLTEISAYEQDGDYWHATEIGTECDHEPPIDSEEWHEWHRGHYSTPYTDWLPYHVRMLKWINDNYQFTDNQEPKP